MAGSMGGTMMGAGRTEIRPACDAKGRCLARGLAIVAGAYGTGLHGISAHGTVMRGSGMRGTNARGTGVRGGDGARPGRRAGAIPVSRPAVRLVRGVRHFPGARAWRRCRTAWRPLAAMAADILMVSLWAAMIPGLMWLGAAAGF